MHPRRQRRLFLVGIILGVLLSLFASPFSLSKSSFSAIVARSSFSSTTAAATGATDTTSLPGVPAVISAKIISDTEEKEEEENNGKSKIAKSSSSLSLGGNVAGGEGEDMTMARKGEIIMVEEGTEGREMMDVTTTTTLLTEEEARAFAEIRGRRANARIFLFCATILTLKHKIEVQAVLDSWGVRCDRIVFYEHLPKGSGNDTASKNPNATIRVFVDHVPKRKDPSWEFLYFIYHNALTELSSMFQLPGTTEGREKTRRKYDDYVVLLTNTDSFVIAENLKHSVRMARTSSKTKNETITLYMGCKAGQNSPPIADGLILNHFAIRSMISLGNNALSVAKSPCNSYVECQPLSRGMICIEKCLKSKLGLSFHETKDAEGLNQIRQAPHHVEKDVRERQIFSKRPVVFFDAGKISEVKTGFFSYLYLYEFFLYRTVVTGLEWKRPHVFENTTLRAQNTYRRRR